MSAATAQQWPQPAMDGQSYGFPYDQQAFSAAQPPPPGVPTEEAPPPPPDAPQQPPVPTVDPAQGAGAADASAAWAAYYQQQEQQQQYDATYAAQWAAYQQQAASYSQYPTQPPQWQAYAQPPQQPWPGYAAPQPRPPQEPWPGAQASAGSSAQAPPSANGTPKAGEALSSVPWRSGAAPLAGQPPAQPSGVQQYNAVPPPSVSTAAGGGGLPPPPTMMTMEAVAAAARAAQQRRAPGVAAKPFTIQPQMAKRKAAGPAHNAFAPAASPAYTKVQEKTAASPAAPAQKDWPPAMRAYVERVFAAGIPPERKAAVQAELREMIQAASAKGELWTRDWDTVPLPSSLTADGGAAARQAAQAAAAAITAKVAQTHDSRWDAARHGAAGAAGMPAADGRGGWKRAQLPDWRPGGDWKKKPDAKRQKKAAHYSRPPSSSSDSDSDTQPSQQSSMRRGPEETARASKRAQRFGDGRADGTAGGQPVGRRGGPDRKTQVAAVAAEEVDFDKFIIQGTCQKLEKSYFRLTSAPDPSVVRPPAVLRRALDRLLRLLRDGAVQYFYAVDQFKGMRQDCTVQHLRDELAVSIYEAAARAALQYGDHAEYNQCQTQLNALHGDGVPGARAEFLAYRLLYQTVHAASGEAVALAAAMRLAVTQAAHEPAVRHAMQVREAVCTHDWSAFFRLYAAAPNMGRALMDMAAPTMRWTALNALVKTFKPSIAVPFVARVLGFAPRLRSPERPDSGAAVNSADAQLSDESPVQEAGPHTGAGSSPRTRSAGDSGAAADDCVAGTGDESAASEAALVVLPGCSQAVYKGKYQVADDPEEAAETCIDWLQLHGAVVQQTSGEASIAALLDCKASTGKLFIPEDTTAVAHGDQNLAISDFLSRVNV